MPGHADEVERDARARARRDDRVYIRLVGRDERTRRSTATASSSCAAGSDAAPLVLAVGPTLDAVLAATADLDVTVAYLATRAAVRRATGSARRCAAPDVVLVEPYLAGTSAAEVSAALTDRPHRLLSLGVPHGEFRHYGDGAEHRAAHGLDARGHPRVARAVRRAAPDTAFAMSGIDRVYECSAQPEEALLHSCCRA